MRHHRFDKLLILDLDETLVYASEHALGRPADFAVGPYHVYKRPHLDQFLETCFEWFTIGLWTSSSTDYATAVVNQLTSPLTRLAFLWTRKRCTRRIIPAEPGEGLWIKDLKKIKNRGYSLGNVIVVDDSPEKHMRNYGNLVRVGEYRGQSEDDELPHLLGYLEVLGAVPNVRSVDKRRWRQRSPSQQLAAPSLIRQERLSPSEGTVDRRGH